MLTLYGERNVMYVGKALHVVYSLIEVKTYMYFVSCSAFIVDISEIEVGGIFKREIWIHIVYQDFSEMQEYAVTRPENLFRLWQCKI